ncbi:MAG: ROK family protein, partial [Pseudonocardiaceae bacterium]
SGSLRVAPNLRFAEGMAMESFVQDRLGLPVVTENDATCACWAEWVMGAGSPYRDLIMVTLGTGIGGGIVSAGRLMRGSNGFAGEYGHMIVNPDGPQCSCGRRGCWERYASGSGLGYLGREAAIAGGAESVLARAGGLEQIRGEHVSAAAADDDADAIRIVGDFAYWVALGLANLVQMLDPAAIVVGGGLVSMGEILFEPVRAELGHMLGHRRGDGVPVLAAALGERAGAMGAALLAKKV